MKFLQFERETASARIVCRFTDVRENRMPAGAMLRGSSGAAVTCPPRAA